IFFLALIVLSTFASKAQEMVTGRITDAATGEPLSGVSVSNGRTTVLTDSAGRYSLQSPGLKAFTATTTGYASRTVYPQGRGQVDLSLYRTIEGVGGKSMSADEDFSMLLGGDVRATSRGGADGLGANVFVRGLHSLNLNARPIIVIDGVIIDSDEMQSVFSGFYINQLATIDVNDIEHVTVMKNATSLYGSKGANGAIIIETKRGKSISTRMTVNANWGFNFRPKTMKMMNDAQFRSYASELMKDDATGMYNADRFEAFLNDDADLTKNVTYNTFHNNHDWRDDVWQTGFRQYYGLQCEGGDEIAKYALSVSYMMGKGNIKTTDMNRLNAHFNADVLLHKNLSLAVGLDFTHIARTILDGEVSETTSPSFLAQIKSPLLLPYKYTDDGIGYTANLSDVDVFGVSNPQSLIDNSKNSFTHYRFGINMMPKWTVTKWFDVSTRFAYNMNAVKEHYYSPIEGIAPTVTDNGFVVENTVKDQSINHNAIYSDTKLHFLLNLDDNHNLDANAGLRIQSNTYKNNYGEGHNTGSDKITNLSKSLDNEVIDGRKTTVRNMAAYITLNYNWMDRLSAWMVAETESCRSFGDNVDDGFRMFGGSWAIFPSGGVKWNVASERFMAKLSFISSLSLRADAGLTGNDAFDVLQRYAYLKAVNWFGSANGLQIGNLKNSSLKWEETKKIGAGIDLGLFGERVKMSFDWYHHTTNDLLMLVPASQLTGLEPYLVNSGSMTNVGYEVNIAARAIDTKNFHWDTRLGFAHYKNKLTKTVNNQPSIINNIILKEGLPVGSFYGYRTVANNGHIVFADEVEAQAAGLNTWNDTRSQKLQFHAGDVHFDDLNSDGVIDENDMTVIGDANPDITGSWQNHFSFGRLALDVMSTFSIGGDIYNYQRHMLESLSSLQNQTVAMTNRWKADGQLTNVPRATFGDPMGNSRFSDRWIEDGSYFKIKEIRLNYTLPLNPTFIRSINVWASVSNVYTFTKYLGADPEVSASSSPLYQGIDYGIPTSGRAVYLGVKLDL
ncbi:MAG: SusC/RagA family TonB-linked outer membrane protein, partial [Prevotellaceae bacterium]|nr:SusC/RagA family TonB-linked outer membrane protein [Prevotellaceae bacterium]